MLVLVVNAGTSAAARTPVYPAITACTDQHLLRLTTETVIGRYRTPVIY
jgi:hypothetical protein